MNIQPSTPTTPLRARMIADMSGRNLGPASQTSHLRACKRLAAWLGRSPETATPDDVKYFQQHLIESGAIRAGPRQQHQSYSGTCPNTRPAMPLLRRTIDHHSRNRPSTALQSTAKTTKGRSMTCAHYIKNDTRSRRLYLLRTNHHTLIKPSMWQKLMTPTKYHEYRPNAGKTNPALSLTGFVQQACQIRSKASPQPKSP